MDWTDLAQNRGKRRAIVNAAKNFLVNVGNYLTR